MSHYELNCQISNSQKNQQTIICQKNKSAYCPQYIMQQLHLGMVKDSNYEEVAFVNEKIKNKKLCCPIK